MGDKIMSDTKVEAKQKRERKESFIAYLITHPIFSVSIAFIGTMFQKKNFRAALKEARYVWRLEVKRNQNGKDRKL